MATPCATCRSFWARRMLGLRCKARLTASTSESGWGMAVLVAEEEGEGWACSSEIQFQARSRNSNASGQRRCLEVSKGQAREGRNPKPEGRRPKEGRNPKAESTAPFVAMGAG